MHLFYRNGFFYVDCEYTYFQFMNRTGFSWNKKDKLWVSPFTVCVKRLLTHKDVKFDKAEMKAAFAEKALRVIKSQAATTLVYWKGSKLFEFQQAGVQFLLESDKTLLADEMGLGKTVQAITYALMLEAKKILIIVPASLKGNWMKELRMWAANKLRPNIMSYEYFRDNANELKETHWDLVIVDEAHYLKDNKAQRTRAILGGKVPVKSKSGGKILPSCSSIKADKEVYITGTPILNRPIELFPLLQHLCPEGFPNKHDFALRYCNGHMDKYGRWDYSGASNLEELQLKLRETVMLRRLKKDVLPQLPKKRYQVIELDVRSSKIEALLDQETKYAERLGFLEKTKNLKGRSESVDVTEWSATRKELGLSKVKPATEIISNILEEREKIVVFCYHKEVVDEILKAFPDITLVLTGDTDVKKRQGIVEEFQTKKEKRIFLCTLKAAGVGLTLTAAYTEIFVELDPTPGVMVQAEDRISRIGQVHETEHIYLVYPDSLDARIAYLASTKETNIDKTVNYKIDKEIEEILS